MKHKAKQTLPYNLIHGAKQTLQLSLRTPGEPRPVPYPTPVLTARPSRPDPHYLSDLHCFTAISVTEDVAQAREETA